MEFIREAGHVGTSYDSHASTPEPASRRLVGNDFSQLELIRVVIFNNHSRHKARFEQLNRPHQRVLHPSITLG